MNTITTSKKGNLNWRDISKSLLIAFLTAFGSNIYEIIKNSITNATFEFPTQLEFKHALFYGLGAGFAYLFKNLFTPSQIVITDAHPDVVQSVKDGDATVNVVTKQ